MSDWTSCPCCDGDGGMTSGSYPDHEVRGGQYRATPAPLDVDVRGDETLRKVGRVFIREWLREDAYREDWNLMDLPSEKDMRAALAATPAPLDVERLARAVSHARTTIDGGGVYTGTGRWVPAADFAAAIAAAYAEETK